MGGGYHTLPPIMREVNPLPLKVHNMPSIHTLSYSYFCHSSFLLSSRFILLRKRPTLLKFICAMVVFGGILFSLIPIIAGMDEESEKGKEQYLQQSRLGQILWPFCFMFGFVSDLL